MTDRRCTTCHYTPTRLDVCVFCRISPVRGTPVNRSAKNRWNHYGFRDGVAVVLERLVMHADLRLRRLQRRVRGRS